MQNFKYKSFSIRKDILNLVYRAKTGHIGGDFSVCDILIILYNLHMNVEPAFSKNPNRDRFIMSKGHSVEALYCVLADKGFFQKSDLDSFSCFDSKYIGHPNNKINGIEMNSGSLGHGLPVAVGMALAGKMDDAAYRVYTVMGDGELAEGSVWEGAMAAGHYQLDNLTAVVDRNRLQISGRTEDVMSHKNLNERFRSFGWNVIQANGNDYESLDSAFLAAKAHKGQPTVIIRDTVKGYGVSFMEDVANWHHRIPTEEEYALALSELVKKEEGTHE